MKSICLSEDFTDFTCFINFLGEGFITQVHTFSFQEQVQEGAPLLYGGEVGVLLVVVKHGHCGVFGISDHVDHLERRVQNTLSLRR